MSANRTIKMLDQEAGERCPRGTKLLRWNQQGPQGVAGADATRTVYTAQRFEDLRVIEPGESLTVAEFDAPDGRYLWDAAVTARPLDRNQPGQLDCTLSWAPQLGRYNTVKGSVDVARSATAYMSALGVAQAGEGPQGVYCTAYGAAVQLDEWRIEGQPVDSVVPLSLR